MYIFIESVSEAIFHSHFPRSPRACSFFRIEACIAQDHVELKAMSIKLLDNFIAKCDSMCVLFTWTYLERLWCVWLGRFGGFLSHGGTMGYPQIIHF